MQSLSEENPPHHLTLIVFHFVVTLKTEANLSAKQCMTREKKKTALLLVQLSSRLQVRRSVNFLCSSWIFFHFDETIFLENKEKKPNRVGSWGSFQAEL